MVIAPGIESNPKAVAVFCRENGIRRLAVFGSALRQDFVVGSDIDLLVEFEPGQTPGMMGLARMQRQLEALLGGDHRVDLRTYGDLSRYFRDEVRSTARRSTARPVFDAAA